MLCIVNGTEIIITSLKSKSKSEKEERVLIMKSYMRTMMGNYFVKNLVALKHVEDSSAEVLKRNSYTLLNVSPRAF